jgi:MOSC domain-containing protein YiiM/ferredoxin-NADP reductase
MASLLSVNVGMPKDVTWQGRTVHTGIWKHSVEGPRMVRRLNIDGDGQGDRHGHGGEQRAVFVYQVDSYRYWEKHLGRNDFEYGQFGENLTVDGLPDDEVCVGDRYRIGGAVFEVTQPRVTCYRVGMRLGEPEMPSLLVAHHRPGFYLRVITEGQVEAGDEIVKVSSGVMTVADIDALLYLPGRDTEALRTAVTIPALSPGWRQSFRELLDPPSHVDTGWPGFRPLRVTRVVAESPAVMSIHLAAADGTPLPPAQPGQYLTVRVPGVGVRSYSLSGDYRISVKREPHGTVSGYLHTHVAEATELEVAAPRGEFVLEPGDGPVVLLSAGIGITPVLAMLHQLAADRSEREVWWLHSTRDKALTAEAHELLATLPNAHEHVYDTATGDRLSALADLPTDATAYVCGPAGFMTAMTGLLTEAGITDVRTETFGGRSAINPGLVGVEPPSPHQPPGTPGTGPRITFARSGLDVRWPDGQESILELAEACDVPTRWSCRTGVCHTCVTPVLSGEIVYPTPPLERPRPGEALICSARPVTDLVLDL